MDQGHVGFLPFPSSYAKFKVWTKGIWKRLFGRVSICVSAGPKEFVKAKSGLTILSDPFAEEEYPICLKKGSELTGKFNDALKELKADGTLDSIVKKYISD